MEAAGVCTIGSRSYSILISVSHLIDLHTLKLFSAAVVDSWHSIVPIRRHISS